MFLIITRSIQTLAYEGWSKECTTFYVAVKTDIYIFQYNGKVLKAVLS